jgi:hypothetical protein
VQHGVERLDVAPVRRVLVVLFLEAALDLVEGSFRQADAAPVALVEVAVIVAKGARHHRVVDDLDGGVHPQVDRPFAVVQIEVIEGGFGGDQTGRVQQIVGEGVAHKGGVAEAVCQ